ncbi:MAG TPA: VWA domain-containing protein [Pyrinomonadaceae bacterium]|nr:VWA domain-containing protein [Pyrinomonadaceae bacterium]
MKRTRLLLLSLAFSAALSAHATHDALAQNSKAPAPSDPRAASTPQRPGTPPAEEEDEVVPVSTSLVNVTVSVLDREGRFVPRLAKDDFRVYDNGVEQRVAHFSPVERPFTVFLMLDTSESTLFRLSDMQEAAVAFVEQLRPQDRVMVVSFSNVFSIKSYATDDREVLREAIRRTTTGGGTSLYPAVDYILKHLVRTVPGRKAVVLFTDGADSAAVNNLDGPGRATFESTLHDAEETEALIYPISYDTLPSMLARHQPRHHEKILKSFKRAGQYLEGLAGRTGGQVFRADSLTDLRAAFTRVAEVLRWQYSLGFYPSHAPAGGEQRRLKVGVTRPDLAVRSRDSYVRR